MAGNYEPCWTKAKIRYQVLGAWPEKLWKQYKLATDVYEHYLYLSRDGVPYRKRNLDEVRQHEAAKQRKEEIADRVARIRSNPQIYRPFPRIAEADEWLALFQADALRYPILVVVGPSFSGKTEWANSLFANALELKVGTLTHFPEKMRSFDRTTHDGVVLDDVRDLRFLTDNQHALQGKYNTEVEFASTPGGCCAYSLDLFAVPMVVTVNHSTLNLGMLEHHDWLAKPSNRRVVYFGGVGQTTGGVPSA